MNNKILGNLGERIAKIYMQMNGYQIIKCNFRSRFGEIDIIAKKDEYIHFIEVKTRTKNIIEAREAINKEKEKSFICIFSKKMGACCFFLFSNIP